MRRISGADAFFLFSERPGWPMHTGSLVVVDPTDAPGYGFDTIRQLLAERIHKIPEFMMKVKEVPFGLDRPLLVQDPDFNLDYHLHHIGVPAPGGPHQLGDLIGELAESQLDRRRPLWEMWVIDGVADGRVALFCKIHHSLIDGVSGAGLAELLCDLEPIPLAVPATPTPSPAPEPERIPSDVELTARGLFAAGTSPVRMARWATDASTRMIRTVREARPRGARTMLDAAPRLPWNGALGPLRRFAYLSVPLGDVKAVRAAFDVKVNDVILALSASALRRYLELHDILPEEPLVASVPMSMRSEGDTELGNKILNMFTSLETHIDDPVERLRSIAEKMDAAKEIGNALKAKEIRRLSESVVPGLANLAWRAYQGANMEARVPMPSNLVISNIPGAPIPLYTAGARIERLHPVPPVVMSQGLNITVMSYLDSVDFGFTVEREMIPDPWLMAEGIPIALAEYTKLAKKQTRR